MPLIDIVQRWVPEQPPDRLFEITETSLAGVSPRAPGEMKQQVFIERSLSASPSAPNLLKPHLYRDALAQVSGSSAGGRSAAGRTAGPTKPATGLVIPDYAVRMAILDFEEFPAREEDRNALIRFRLRKTVPFHIDEAQVAYSIQVDEPKRIEVLAIAIARPILTEYETLFTDAGYRVGLVTPSSIAALPLYARPEPGLTVVAKAAGSTLSVLLLEHGRVRLVRCLDLASAEGEELEQGDFNILALLQQTLAYAEDEIGQPATRLLLCGFGPETTTFGRLAEEELRIPYSTVQSRFGAASQQNAGLLGLLEQYAA
jgi:type IV pilus assembly protein PilM